MGRPSAVRVSVVAALLAVVAVACGHDRSAVRAVGVSSTVATTSSTTPAAAADPSSTVPTSTTAASRAAAQAGGASESPAPVPEAAASSARAIDQIGDTGGAAKVITVVSSSWSSATATLTLWERSGHGSWGQAGGPWEANVGGAGWAFEPGEATRRSPIGSFGFGGGFGLQPDPGYAGGWFVIGDTDYWVEDPASPDYNTHHQGPVDPAQAPWGHFEHLADFPVAYRYVALIDFNVPPSGGIGSGIFLHESTGGSTAGCVSLPEDELLTTLRWIDPGSTRIVMGPESELAKL